MRGEDEKTMEESRSGLKSLEGKRMQPQSLLRLRQALANSELKNANSAFGRALALLFLSFCFLLAQI